MPGPVSLLLHSTCRLGLQVDQQWRVFRGEEYVLGLLVGQFSRSNREPLSSPGMPETPGLPCSGLSSGGL
eukprot:1496490-Alexandrium_andersonii.AAC.1